MNVMLSHSDHSPILLEVCTGKEDRTRTTYNIGKMLSSNKRRAGKFRQDLDIIITSTDLDGLSIQQKCSVLQRALVEATSRSCQEGLVRKGKQSFAP